MITGCVSILLKVLLPLELAPLACRCGAVDSKNGSEVSQSGGSALETVRIGRLPAPAVLAHALQVEAGGPAQLLARQRRIGVAGGDVARAAGDDLVGDLAAAGLGEGVHQFQHAVAAAGAQVDPDRLLAAQEEVA